MQKVLVLSTGRRLNYFQQYEQLAQLEKLMFRKGIIEFLPSRLFYILIANLINYEIDAPKHMVIGQSSDTFSTVTCQQLLVDTEPKPNDVNKVSANLSQSTPEETK